MDIGANTEVIGFFDMSPIYTDGKDFSFDEFEPEHVAFAAFDDSPAHCDICQKEVISGPMVIAWGKVGCLDCWSKYEENGVLVFDVPWEDNSNPCIDCQLLEVDPETIGMLNGCSSECLEHNVWKDEHQATYI